MDRVHPQSEVLSVARLYIFLPVYASSRLSSSQYGLARLTIEFLLQTVGEHVLRPTQLLQHSFQNQIQADSRRS